MPTTSHRIPHKLTRRRVSQRTERRGSRSESVPSHSRVLVSLRSDLLRGRHPHAVGHVEIDACDLRTEIYILQTRLLARCGRKPQQILIVEYLLEAIEVGGETHRVL